MTILIFSISLILITLDLHSQVGREWVKTYHGSGTYAVGNDVTLNARGDLYVTGGAVHTGTGLDYVTVKYSSSGMQQWLKTYDGPGNSFDMASFIKTDAIGDIIVAGTSESSGENPDFAVIKYNSLGEQLWIQRFDGGGQGYGGDNVKGIELDTYCNIYLTGTSAGISTSNDIVIIKYAPGGSLLWIVRYNFSDDQASAIKVDNSGNVYVSGCSLIAGSMGYTLLKYNSAGSLLWVRNYNSAGFNDDRTTALSIDNHGNIIVTGFSVTGATGYDYTTIKYNPAGDMQWMKVYDGSAGSTENPVCMAVDNSNNVYVSGSSAGLGTQSDAATVKYNSNGDQLWVRRYDGQAHSNDYVNDMSLDDAGNIYIASTCNFYNTFADFNILKYDASGNLIWSRAYGGNAYQDDEVKSIISDNKGNIFVCGKTIDSASGGIFCTAKYTESVFHDIEMGRFVNFPTQFIVNKSYNLKASVYNNGSSAESNFQIKWVINGNIINTSNISMNSGFEDIVSHYWTPQSAGIYEVKYISALTDDSERGNDTIIRTIPVIEMPTQTSSINICRSGLNAWIPNNSTTPLYDTIYFDIPNSIGVIDVNVVIDTILHPRVSDLEISLRHLQVTDSLITRRGPGSNFINTKLNDSASADISQGTAPFSSSFKPESPLTSFNGINVNGAWILKISDHAAGETGFLKSWCLQIKYQLVTGIIENENIPSEFTLEQNFPNPFNPKTKIKFGVPGGEKTSVVRLIIYDILGREAAVLINEKLSPGIHEIEWDASNYASGVYYCILEAGLQGIGRKMVLIK